MSLMRMFESPKLDSKIKSRNTTGKERILGYLIGPAGVIVFNQIVQSYLNVYYTDALGATMWLGGAFLVLFPIISKILDAVTNIIMAGIIDRTKTRQGKLRPFLLLSIPVLLISAVMLFAVPKASQTVQMIWIVVSYNLYYSIAYTMYTISQNMMVATSTRNSEQRTVLGIFSSASMFGIGGIFAFALFPMLVFPIVQRDPSKWLPVMSVFAALILPLTLIQFFYTKERVTEEDNAIGREVEKVSMWEEFKTLASDKYWVFFMLAVFMKELAIRIGNSSAIYYCNWVVANDYTQGNGFYSLLNILGGGLASFLITFFVWPIVKKVGKTRLMVISMALMAVGMTIGWLVPRNWPLVLASYFIAQLGSSTSSFITYAMLADVVDDAEWRFGRRSDGLSGAAITVIMTISMGLGTGLFNAVLASAGYQAPAELLRADGSYGPQSAGVQGAIIFMMFGASAILYALSAFFFSRDKAEKNLPVVQKELMERKKAAAAEAGIEWVDPVEAAKKEALDSIEESYQAELEQLNAKAANGKDISKAKAKLDAKFQKKRDKVSAR